MIERDGNDGEIIPESTEPDLSLDGTHMILTRCNFQLVPWRDWLISQGIPWHNPYRPEDRFMNPTSSTLWKIVRTYAMLKDGDIVNMMDVLKMIDGIKAEGNLIHGAKRRAKWDTEEFNFNWMETVDYRNINRLGMFTEEFCTLKKPIDEVFILKGKVGDLIQKIGNKNSIYLKQPTTIISTVHGVKGGEATNVWIDRRTSLKGHQMWHNREDARNDEARVAYVAVTRAKERMGLLIGKSKMDGFDNQAFNIN